MPGIATSGYGSAEDVARSLEASFSTHLVKPLSSSVLARAIREVVASTPWR